MNLLNGNDHERTRNSDSCRVLACGCAHDDRAWLQLCDPHFAEADARHRLAAAQYTLQSARRPESDLV